MDNARAEILEGLNVFRALETWGATVYAAWAADEPDARLRAGHLIIAERAYCSVKRDLLRSHLASM